jgi:two-component system, NarL family, nitrate/nitrite response regulator NarL
LPSSVSPMTREIRILLVDDHSLFRESLSRLLEAEPGFHVIGSCGTAREAIDVLSREEPDVVLLDYDLGDERGTNLVDMLRSQGFNGQILMVTAGMNDADTLRAFESGLSGIFLKHSPPARLVEAIHRVVGGEKWIDSRTLQSLIAGAGRKAAGNDGPKSLSAREKAILKSLPEGLTNKELATSLQISETAVKWSIQQLFDKFGVRTRSQLVRIAIEQGAQDW